ncbi:uncharacterized protein LOC121518531 [Cheilinus undulatus]|uniref:uncharacterized protein LOC121518531 n=1 Tax=Cheilinus undulatus TaxID=241271 RepID=UPI001BD4BEF4|nr:uncharacterized protein LOC121518531 [Cheilinus undulatus]
MSREESEDTGYVRRDVKEAVRSYLPGLPDDLLTTMLDELGVESIDDLTLMEERDLVKYLKPIQSRKLMKGIKYGLVTLNMQVVSAPDQSAPSSPNTPATPQAFQLLVSPPSTAPSTSSASQTGVPWHVDFHLNWDQVSSAIRLRVEKEERPLPDKRKAFVVMLVDQMMQHDRNPSRAMCHSVVRNIVRSYPKTFADIGKHGDTAGDGCHSLLQQVKTKVEYKNRNNTLARCRREGRPRTGMAGEARLARGPIDQYGCVRWGPADLPEGETEATLENMKRDLLNIYSGMQSTVFLPCATAVDVNTAELPSTPCLIIQGDMMKPSGWLISIEGHVVMGPHPLFLHGVAAFFSSYYVFNLEYPATGSSTLEFIQRCFLGINPERGSQTKKRTTMNPHVSTLLRKLIDFEWAS